MRRLITLITVLIAAGAMHAAESTDAYLWQTRADVAVSSEGARAVQQKLTAEIRRMIAAGHLAPLRISTGESGGETWFVSPGTLAYSIAIALPYLDEPDRKPAGEYLKRELTTFPPHKGLLPLNEGVRRELYSAPPGAMPTKKPPAHSVLSAMYGLWAYGHYSGDWQTVAALYEPASQAIAAERAKIQTLQDVQGIIGMARIARKLKKSEAASLAIAAQAALQQSRDVENFALNATSLYNKPEIAGKDPGRGYYKGFWDLAPEMGRFLAENVQEKSEAIRADLEWRIPMWYANRAAVPNEWWPHIPAAAEDTFCPPRIAGPIFLMRAYIPGDDAATLQRFLDIPYCPGDLDYLQQCVALLRAYGGAGWVEVK